MDVGSDEDAILIYTYESRPEGRVRGSSLLRVIPGADTTQSGVAEVWLGQIARDTADDASFMEALYLKLAEVAA